jgi:hypothetical protein
MRCFGGPLGQINILHCIYYCGQSGLQNHDASEHKKASRERTWFIRIPQAEDFSSHFLNIHSIYDLF